MSLPRPKSALTLLVCLALAAGCSDEVEGGATRAVTRPADGTTPAPTEHWLDEKAEGTNKSERKAWFAHRHQAAPGVDWKELERANGQAQVERRNRLGRQVQNQRNPWVERGSDNLAGRVHAMAYAPDFQSLYLGSSLGGVWEGGLQGEWWEPIGDNLYGGAHHLAVVSGAAPGDEDVVLAASNGGLVHVSRDRGRTWVEPAGLGTLHEVKRVLTSSEGSETVFLVRRRSSGWRLMRSTDRCASFEEVFVFSSFAGDAWITRDGSADLYVMASNGVWRSTDLGDSWTNLGPAPGAGSRAELVGSEAGAPRLWSVKTSGSTETLYRSDDAGASWTTIANIGDYWNELNASITDVDLFMFGGVETHRTTNGGASFSVINTWGEYYSNPLRRLHADIQGIDVLPSSSSTGETWYISTDGGLYRSTNGLQGVLNLSMAGLRVSQYYATHTSSANPDHVLAGAQDQGYQRADSPPGGTTRLLFEQEISGDYGHLTSGDGTHGHVFSTYPGFVLAQVGENSPFLYLVDFPGGVNRAWLPPVVADPLAPSAYFFVGSRLYRYTKSGTNWNGSLWSTRDFAVSGGEYLSALTFSPVDPQRAYAASDRGRLYHSTDRGVTWTQSSSTGPSAHYFYGTALLASSLDVDTVWVAGSGYSGPAVYESTDGGVTFTDASQGLPPTLVYCLAEAPDGSGRIFCGTETSAYVRAPGGAWVDITTVHAPVTIYWSVEALPHENTMRFGTYGRGIWDYRLDVPSSVLARNGGGTNPGCLSSLSEPRLGSTWQVRVDPTLVPGTVTARVFVRARATQGLMLPQGELLASGPRYLASSLPADPAGTVFRFPIPDDASLMGLTATAQGALVGSATRLCNALDVVLGR